MQQDQEKATQDVSEIPTMGKDQLSEGELIMNISFQPNGRKDVSDLKRRCADLYDWLLKECSKVNESGDIDAFNRKQRLKSIALTHLETFQMNAVKSLTFTKEVIEPFPAIAMNPAPTDGCMVMTLDFNVNSRDDVKFIKTKSAELYDDMQNQIAYRNSNFQLQEKKFYEDYWLAEQKKFDALPEDEQKKIAEERKQLRNMTHPQWSDELILEHRKLHFSVETMGEALYSLRQFQMFAVKAVTR